MIETRMYTIQPHKRFVGGAKVKKMHQLAHGFKKKMALTTKSGNNEKAN